MSAVAKYITSLFSAHKATIKKAAIDTAVDQSVKQLIKASEKNNKKMGGWFSKTEVVQTGNASVDYHPETLGWTLGAISFMLLTIGCLYFFMPKCIEKGTGQVYDLNVIYLVIDGSNMHFSYKGKIK